ncbi:MAG: PIN domain-containing protein [Myxococcota bacterium]|nr:PIN domain-containing protein [Myxococcota bacterium]
MILDTNAVSALFAGDSGIKRHLMGGHKHHLPLIVCGEYRFGLLNSSKEVLLTSLLESLEKESYLLSLDVQTSKHYAHIRQQLKTCGTPIPENDIWIAALAAQYALPILSNDKHFDYVHDIKRIDW